MTTVTSEAPIQDHHDEHHHEQEAASKALFGFWIYLLSDSVVFAVLFAVYAVLHNNTFGGVGIKQVASLPYVFIESFALLTSSLTYGFALITGNKGRRNQAIFWMVMTILLGLVFVGMEINEFAYLIHTGNSWQRSAFLSSFFALIGIHGVHVIIGMIWMVILIVQLLMKNTTHTMKTRLACLGLFWNFLDIIWIFIFTLVYLLGAV